MNVSIIGTGYVGLVTGVCLAHKGHDVVCVDVDREKTDKINRGIAPIYEVGLPELLRETVNSRLKATVDLEAAVVGSDITLIAVGTPFDGSTIDLTYIKEAARQIGTALKSKAGYHIVAIKSTVVPGTTDDVVLPILEQTSGKKAGRDFGVGMNPEFLTEGEAVKDFMFPDRIVLGGTDARTIAGLDQLYSGFEGIDRVRTNNKTAEMIKYASNSLLATMISFSNELGNLCSTLGGVDITDVLKGLHLSKYLSPMLADGTRITPSINSFLWAGCGFGGSCLPKDVKALIAHGERAGAAMPLLNAVIEINQRQHRQILSLLSKHFDSLQGVHVAVLGLAFRPGTDDMRESPAIPVIQALLSEGAAVRAYDPIARPDISKLFNKGPVVLSADLSEAVRDADAIILITRWEEFENLPELLASSKSQPVVIDGRRMLDKTSVARYEGIGA
jgi:UDPglucose 6-dehydrogenase